MGIDGLTRRAQYLINKVEELNRNSQDFQDEKKLFIEQLYEIIIKNFLLTFPKQFQQHKKFDVYCLSQFY